jgi:hypothetical protein
MAKAKKRTAVKTAARVKSAASQGDKQNKSAFVRSLPEHMPAQEVVDTATAKGMKISVAYVYSIRTATKAKERAVTSSLLSRAGRPAASSSGRVEDLLRAVAAELGLSRAIGILQGEQAKVRAVLGA